LKFLMMSFVSIRNALLEPWRRARDRAGAYHPEPARDTIPG
jgi:hypothetical protein